MFHFVTGDLLQSEAQALVNTVNCEGYMGKGIAYQFKLKYPEMNAAYVKKCKAHKLVPGQLDCFVADSKIIINFPTKNKWREKSKMEYISSGLDALLQAVDEYHIASIAIPPLGSGNGGLIWAEVKSVILKKLEPVSDKVEVYIYEPSKNYKAVPTSEPQLFLSALILMNIKFKLPTKLFNKKCLQKTAYFMDILSNTKYFNFKRDKYGPYDHSIDVICKNIQEFQIYHGVKSTQEAYDILMQKLISQKTQDKLNFYIPYIIRAAEYTNSLGNSTEVECAGTALYLIEEAGEIDINGIIKGFQNWSEDKAKRFPPESIKKSIDSLEEFGMISRTLCGFQISR